MSHYDWEDITEDCEDVGCCVLPFILFCCMVMIGVVALTVVGGILQIFGIAL